MSTTIGPLLRFAGLFSSLLAVLWLSAPLSAQSSEPLPAGYEPLLVLDCQHNNEVLRKKCFSHVLYISQLVEDSALFRDFISPSHLYFLVKRKKPYEMVNFTSVRPYTSAAYTLKSQALQIYKNSFRQVIDSRQRYAMFLVAANPRLAGSEVWQRDLAQLKLAIDVYLQKRKVSYAYAGSHSFAKMTAGNFSFLAGYIRLEFAGEQEILAMKSRLLRLEEQINAVQGVSYIYSPATVMSELALVTNRYRGWTELFPLWELSGQEKSSFWQKEEGAYYIALYKDPKASIDTRALNQLLQKNLNSTAYTILLD